MKARLQFGGLLCALGLGAAMAVTCANAQNRPSARPPQSQPQASRPPQNNRPAGSYHPQNMPRQDSRGGGNRQQANPPRNDGRNSARNDPRNNGGNNSRDNGANNNRQQQRAAVPPPNVQDRLRNMSPQQKSQLAENQRKFNQLPPQKQQEMRQAANNWNRLTPEQQSHIKNDVIPKWKQLPPDRQKAIQQRLGVLQNMPESARNRHLSDPNFTRGMSEEDKQMLQDLSHQHVGAPDRPQEQ
jgi:hypothetical protein